MVEEGHAGRLDLTEELGVAELSAIHDFFLLVDGDLL